MNPDCRNTVESDWEQKTGHDFIEMNRELLFAALLAVEKQTNGDET